MATKKITELVEITAAANDDVLPIVDISTDITNKIKVENLPISNDVQTALNGKEDLANKSTSVTSDQASNTKYPSVKAVYDWAVGLFATLSQLATKQDTLVSGTNIKTVNSTSLLGSGDIPIPIVNPSGVAGSIQFSDGSAFSSDATNLFWDNTNKRLGLGTSSPTQLLHLASGVARLRDLLIGQAGSDAINNTSLVTLKWGGSTGIAVSHSGGINAQSTFHIKGSGTTSATTALLVQNSAGTNLLTVRDDGVVLIPTISSLGYSSAFQRIALSNATGNQFAILNSTSAGCIRLSNNAENDFDRLQFGGTSASFPAIKRASNNLEIRNANDTFGAGLSVGGALNASAILQADSTTQGFLPPRMTTTEKNAISSPSSGLQVYDTTLNQMSYYNGSSWINF